MFDSSDNDNISNSKKKIRRNKKLYFEKERNEIVDNLINFINNSKDGEYIFLIDLQHNEQLIKYINDNVENIKKWYRCSSWGYFVSENNNQQSCEITLMKSILKDLNNPNSFPLPFVCSLLKYPHEPVL